VISAVPLASVALMFRLLWRGDLALQRLVSNVI
jgi:hypothetical protein